MTVSYTYPLASFVGLTAAYPSTKALSSEVAASAIVPTLDGIGVESSIYSFSFVVALSTPEQTILNGIVAAHTGVPLKSDDLEDNPVTQVIAPTVTDDASQGFSLGSLWYTQSGNEYVCLDATAGAASWVLTTVPSTKGAVLITATSETEFSSIGAALAAASSGELVRVGPGTYAENVIVPAGVFMRGLDGAHIIGSVAAGTKLTLGDGAEVWGFDVTSPSDATAAVHYSGNFGATIHDTTVIGGGPSGIGFLNSGLGVMFVDRARITSGSIDALCKSTSGKLQLNSIFVASGTLTSVLEASGGSTIEGVGVWAVAPSVVTNGFLVHDATISAHGGQIAATNVLRITSDLADADIEGGFEFKGSTYDILVDAGVTSATVEVEFCQLRASKISADPAQLASANWVAIYVDGTSEDVGVRIEGELGVGTVEKPSESIFGEGDSYVRGMVVLTTDATASPTSDGANFVDESVAAAGSAGPTFSFQGTLANHTILIGSERATSAGVVRHWGHKVKVSTAAVETTPKSFVYEIWDGAVWVSIGTMSTHSSNFHRYGNSHFIRASNSEHIRYGVDENTVWVKKTINGKNLYWSRVRVTSDLTSAPVFDQFKVHSNRTEINGDGTVTFHGLARFSNTLLSAGNVFGESGGVVNYGQVVGSGALPTGWTHQVKNSQFNGLGDAIYFQFQLPHGIDTSFPMRLKSHLTSTITDTSGSADIQLIASFLPLEVQNVLVADPSGGSVPVPRSMADTETFTSKPGQASTVVINSIDSSKALRVDFGDFDVSSYYEGDLVFMRVEMDLDGGANVNINLFSLDVSGVRWTHGEHR